MRTVSQSEAIASLPSLLEEVEREPIVIEKDGRKVAVLSSPDDFDTTRRARVARFLRSLDEAGNQVRKQAAEDGLSPDDLMKILDRKADAPEAR